jgi:hypothetical protein
MGEEIDWGKVSEYEQALEGYTAEKPARIRVFDPKEITRKAKQIREIVDEDLGTIRYVLLNYNELNEIIEKYQDNKERSVQLLFKQLVPANPGLTVENIKEMPYEVVVRLLTKLQREGSFFPRKPSPSGLQRTQKPKSSDSSPTSTATSFTG